MRETSWMTDHAVEAGWEVKWGYEGSERQWVRRWQEQPQGDSWRSVLVWLSYKDRSSDWGGGVWNKDYGAFFESGKIRDMTLGVSGIFRIEEMKELRDQGTRMVPKVDVGIPKRQGRKSMGRITVSQLRKYSRNEECPGGGEMTSPRWVAGGVVCMGLCKDEMSWCMWSSQHWAQALRVSVLNPLDLFLPGWWGESSLHFKTF